METPNHNNQPPNPYQSQSQDPQPYNPQQPQLHPHRPTCGLAITSMVLGILALAPCYTGIIFGGIGVIFGHISMGKFKKDPNLGGRGMAIAGLVTGYIGILISVFLIIVAIVTTNSAINASGSSTFREAIEQSIKAQQDKQENITSPEPDSAEQSIQTEN